MASVLLTNPVIVPANQISAFILLDNLFVPFIVLRHFPNCTCTASRHAVCEAKWRHFPMRVLSWSSVCMRSSIAVLVGALFLSYACSNAS